ncbi:MAG: type I-A CRISPR-associated protein Cas4/Csa1 [Candidatus Bathyarchaeia archaeon]
MYFLSDLEHKYLIHRLLPAAREARVSAELRGWSWHQPPLKPYYEDVKLPMYAVCSKYCPTGRDIYLNFVEKISGTLNSRMALGKILHGVVSDCLQAFLQKRSLNFELWEQKIRWDEIPAKREEVLEPARKVWEYLVKICEARYVDIASSQPYASEQDLLASTVPFLVEHKISGELLGLSGLLSLDCYDYMRAIMFDLKVGDKPQDWHRLAPVGYSIVFESVHEVPVDVCCVVYLNLTGNHILVKKDLFFASDELRNMWIEERDRKLEIVAERRDPGRPERSQCTEECRYYQVCYS